MSALSTRRRPRPVRRPAVLTVVLGLLAGLVACGVQPESTPQPLDSALANQPPPPSGIVDGSSLFFVQDDRLAPVSRSTAGGDRGRLLVLLAGVTQPEATAGLRTAIPASVRLRDVRRAGPLLTVDLTGDLGEASAEEQALALAQIVFTATETTSREAGPTAVRLLVDGAPVQVPREDGTLDSNDLQRRDFDDQAPPTSAPRARASGTRPG